MNEDKVKEHLVNELIELRQRVAELEKSERECKEAEESLRSSEERYRDLFENANDLVQSVDMNAKFVYVNKKWREMLGYNEEEVEELTLWDILHEDQIPHCMEVFKRVCSGEEINSMETVFVSKSGKEIYVEGNVNTYFKDEKNLATRGIFRDVTERKKAEKALRSSEERYRTIFELSPEAIALLDTEGRLLDVNERLYDWLGYKREEVVGRRLLELPFLPDGSKRKAVENFSQRILGRALPPYDLDFIAKSGGRVIGQVRAIPIKDENGKTVRDLVMISDVTERKKAEETLRKSEEKYRLHFENISDIIIAMDPELNIVDVAPSIEKVLGYSPKELVGKNLLESNLLTPESMELTFSNFSRLLEGKSILSDEYEVIAKDGSIKIIEIHVNPIFENGEISRLITIGRDVGERKKAEEAMINANEQLEMQVQQQKEIAEALVADVGMERASGILYECGWNVATQRVKGPRREWKGTAREFMEKYFELSKHNMDMDVKLVELDEVNKRARIVVKHSHDLDKPDDTGVTESGYLSGFFAGLLSRAFGKAVGVKNTKSAARGDKYCEFVTRKLEPYERKAYALGG